MEALAVEKAASPSSSPSKPGSEVVVDGGGGACDEQRLQAQAGRRVRRKTLVAVLEECRRALELLRDSDLDGRGGSNAGLDEGDEERAEEKPLHGSSSPAADSEADELHALLKSKVESPNFLEKLGSIHISVSQNASVDERTTWDVVTSRDLWDDKHSDVANGSNKCDDDYVLVRQEDIADGIACFMAAHLLSLKETKELTPNQLQEALSKTFSIKKKKGKLRKAWDGGKVIYNVVSWSATAIGIYQNPALFRAASVAVCTSCHAISKLF